MPTYYVARTKKYDGDPLFGLFDDISIDETRHDVCREFEEHEHEKALVLVQKCNEIRHELLSSHDYQCAVWSQNACNLSGIVFEFERIMHKICREAELFGHGTEWKNTHPIARLYAEQIAHLTSARDYSDAARHCEERQS